MYGWRELEVDRWREVDVVELEGERWREVDGKWKERDGKCWKERVGDALKIDG
jgi:hypothetical protein